MRRRNFTDRPLLKNQETYYAKTEKAGRMSNLALAAMITAFIRVRIFDLQRQAGKKFIACFTDSILTQPHKGFKTGNQLGDLEFKGNTDLLIIGSGVYETNEECKLRGFRLRKGQTLKTLLRMRKNSKRKSISIPQTTRISAGIMIRRPLVRYAEFNEILPTDKDLDLNFDAKRKWAGMFVNAAKVFKSKIKSQAIILLDKRRKK